MTLRTALAFGLLCLSLGACRTTRGLASDERAELLRVREAVWRAWFEGDSTTLEHLLTDDFLALDPEGGIRPGRAHQLEGSAAFRESGGRLTSLSFPETEIWVHGDVAVIYTTYAVELAGPSGPSRMAGRATEVFVRCGDSWVHPGWHMDVEE